MTAAPCARSLFRLLSALFFWVALVSPLHAEERKPNIIFILADDLGYGDLGCFGQETLKTPRLDAMAKEGMRFTQFYAGCTVCAPSRSVLMTGKHMGRTVVRGNSTEPIVLTPQHPTVASVLKKAGYKTACIGKWGLGTPDKLSNPNDVGFDHFYGYVDMWHAHNFYPNFLIRNGEVEKLPNEQAEKWKSWQTPGVPQHGRGVAVKREAYAPDLFVEDVERFIRANHKDPFFLFFSLNVPHANNEAGKAGMEVPDLGEFADKDWPEPEKGFAAMIKNIDRDTGRVLDLLKELKIEKDTLVIFTSDNGPHQEGGHLADFFDSNGELRGKKRDLTEGGIRVPTIAWWPGHREGGWGGRCPLVFWGSHGHGSGVGGSGCAGGCGQRQLRRSAAGDAAGETLATQVDDVLGVLREGVGPGGPVWEVEGDPEADVHGQD